MNEIYKKYETTIEYVVGTLTPISDLRNGLEIQFSYLPCHQFEKEDLIDIWSDNQALSNQISVLLNGYFTLASTLAGEAQMEILGFAYYLLLAIRGEIEEKSKNIEEIPDWENSFYILEELLKDLVNENEKYYV